MGSKNSIGISFTKRFSGRHGAAMRFVVVAVIATGALQARAAELTDERLDKAIDSGIKFLFAGKTPAGSIESSNFRQADGGAEALVAWAAMEAGKKPDYPPLASVIEHLKNRQPGRIYARAVRTIVFARLGGKFNQRAVSEGTWLIRKQGQSGGWGVTDDDKTPNTLDTAMALLAIRHANECGLHVSQAVLDRARKFLTGAQNPDGGFGYHPPNTKPLRLRGMSHGSATAAGAAALGVLVDLRASRMKADRTLEGLAGAKLKLPAELQAYERAMGWLNQHFTLKDVPRWYWGASPRYTYWFMLSLATEALSPMRLAKHDLDEELAAEILPRQKPDGGFDGETLAEDRVVSTAYAVLCLSQIRKPPLINKISLGTLPLADYNDAANLCREANRKLNRNRKLTWRQLTQSAPLEKLRQAPVLYLSVGTDPQPTGDFSVRLEEYLDNGGVVIVQPLAGDKNLTEAAFMHFNDLYEDSSARAVVFADKNLHGFPVAAVGPAGRQKIFLLQCDLSKSWHKGYHKTRSAAFEMFFDLMSRATGSNSLQRKFSLAKPVRILRTARPKQYIRIACLASNDEKTTVPAAVRKLSNELAAGISVGIKQIRLLPGKQIDEDYPLAWLSDINAFSPSDFKTLKEYVERGGLLLIDGDGRDESFKKAEKLLGQMFSANAIEPVPADHPLLSGKFGGGIGSDIRQVQYNPAAAKRVGNTEAKPQLLIVKRDGRVVVVLSRYGIAAPAGGTPPAGYVGYKSKDAQRIALNILLYNCAARQNSAKGSS